MGLFAVRREITCYEELGRIFGVPISKMTSLGRVAEKIIAVARLVVGWVMMGLLWRHAGVT
jgi:hypothetical protein